MSVKIVSEKYFANELNGSCNLIKILIKHLKILGLPKDVVDLI